MDRLLNSLFFRITNKLLVNMDWAGSRNVGDRSQVVNPFDHVESSNIESHQPVLIPKPSSIDPHFQQPHTISVDEHFNPKILPEVKRETENEKNEMALENMQDNTTQTNQFGTGPSSTDNHHLFHQMDSSLEDGQLSNQPISTDLQNNVQVSNDIQDWDEHEIEKGERDDEQMMHIGEEEVKIVDGSGEEEVGDDETDSDNVEEDENSQNEESSRLVESPPMNKPSPPSQSPIRRQSDRVVKQKQTEDQRPKQMANRDSKVDDEIISRPVKRLRSSRSTTSSSTKQKKIITQLLEKINNGFSTNPIQPNRQLQCSHCHKSFVYRSALQTHLRVHTGERPFQCDLCVRRFNKRTNLTQHQLIHQNIKSFRCHECDKQFTKKYSLDTHLLVHSGERPFECRHCEKSFTQSNTRTKHERAIHLHVKPYRCKQCGHTATDQSYIIKHIRMVHFGLPQTIKEQRALNIIDDRDPRELVEKV